MSPKSTAPTTSIGTYRQATIGSGAAGATAVPKEANTPQDKGTVQRVQGEVAKAAPVGRRKSPEQKKAATANKTTTGNGKQRVVQETPESTDAEEEDEVRDTEMDDDQAATEQSPAREGGSGEGEAGWSGDGEEAQAQDEEADE